MHTLPQVPSNYPEASELSDTAWLKSADWLNWPCPVMSALKRTPLHDFNYFSIMFCYIISNTYQKIGHLFCPAHISELSQCVNNKACTRAKLQPFTWKVSQNNELIKD